ncbi:MAG: thioredoxin family protein [Candidatus Hydrogenedentes bacterium]|nr:thioredoxin family protein [Candidatus Hydrogenedentota bacterium]
MASTPETPGIGLIDFYAPWCVQCALQWEEIEKLRQELAVAVPVRRVNVDRELDAVCAWRIQRIPTLVVLADAREIARYVGTQEPYELRKLMEQLAEQHATKGENAGGRDGKGDPICPLTVERPDIAGASNPGGIGIPQPRVAPQALPGVSAAAGEPWKGSIRPKAAELYNPSGVANGPAFSPGSACGATRGWVIEPLRGSGMPEDPPLKGVPASSRVGDVTRYNLDKHTLNKGTQS